MNGITTERPCAWCQKEQGIEPQPDQSHTICVKHAIDLVHREHARHAAELEAGARESLDWLDKDAPGRAREALVKALKIQQ